MKPIILQDTINKLKGIIQSATGSGEDREHYFILVDGVEDELRQLADDRENQWLLYGAGGLLLILAGVLTYTLRMTWPLMFVVVWLGALLYYRVTERSQMTDNLILKSRITPASPIPKMDYLIGVIDLKLARKTVLKAYLSLVLSAAVMMAHHIFVDSSVTINMILLMGAILVSYAFWNHFYKEDTLLLTDLREQLHTIKNQLILDQVFAV